MPSVSHRAAGFTLLELIVAASILALIAVFSWRGLDTLLRERDAIASSQETIDVMQRSFARIERDAMLARDAEIDDSGALRLVSGNAAVEYRVVDGALTRATEGASAPMVLQSGIAKLVIEAWTAGAKGGAWVRVKGLATEPLPPPPQQPRPAGVVASPNAASNPGAPPATANNAANSAALGTAAATGNANPPAGPLTALGQPLVAAATGIRLSIARVDGTEVVRIFLIGSGG
ncbi:MAG: PulJ/GspJ family protein [Burkholderiaceae bacterium]